MSELFQFRRFPDRLSNSRPPENKREHQQLRCLVKFFSLFGMTRPTLNYTAEQSDYDCNPTEKSHHYTNKLCASYLSCAVRCVETVLFLSV
jgi:hypothetical protein